MLSWHAAISQTTTWRTRHARICAGAWGERPRPGRPTSGPFASHSRSRSGGFSSDGWRSCRTELAAWILAEARTGAQYEGTHRSAIMRRTFPVTLGFLLLAPITTSTAPPTRHPTLASAVRVTILSTRSEEHTSELQSHSELVCRLPLEKKKTSTSATDANVPHNLHVLGPTDANG